MPATSLAAHARAAPRPQTFADAKDRARLSEVAAKAFLNLVRAWGVSNTEAAALIGVSPSGFDRMKRGRRAVLSQDQLTRVSALVGIFKGLHMIFADETADARVQRENSGPLFERRTPVAAMIDGGIPAMLEVRRYVDAVRGGL